MIKKNLTALIGAHMSIAGGLYKAFDKAASINSTAMQIFTHSNRQWRFKDIPKEDIEKFKEAQKETSIIPVVHASYLINLCSENSEVHEKSRAALEKELYVAEELGINYVVLHPGYSTDAKKGLEKLANDTNKILDKIGKKTAILFENMAGQKNAVCSSFEELATLYSKIEHKTRVGFCLDTCHAWAFGYDFSTAESYKKMMHSFDSIVGLEKLKVIHTNDSKKELGSKVDRHELIGKGKIGLTAFELIMNDKKLIQIPKILEIPVHSMELYKKDMDLLKSLIRS